MNQLLSHTCKHLTVVVCPVLLSFLIGQAFLLAEADPPGLAPEDADYIARFHEQFPRVDPVPTLADYATPTRFDERFLGEPLDTSIEIIKAHGNEQGNLAWGIAYWMIAYNQMYRTTRDAKYLDVNLRCIDAVLSMRDDKQGVKLFTGEIAPAWSSDKYAKRGRAVFGVHTGMLVYPMLDFLILVEKEGHVLPAESERVATIQKEALEALRWHDHQWRDGPVKGEGHYVMMNQEEDFEGEVMPVNRLSALGRALWTAWKLTSDNFYKDRALCIARYIKARLAIGKDGAYYWPYWLPKEPPAGPVDPKDVNGEDASHAQLTISFPLMLAHDGEVFSQKDIERFALTARNGIGRLGTGADNPNFGVLLSSVTGSPKLGPNYVANPDGWLIPAWTNPDAKATLSAFYLNFQPKPSAGDLATLISLTSSKQ